MNTHQIGLLLIATGVLSACASSHETYPAASPSSGHPYSVVRAPDGDWLLRGDGTLAAQDVVQRPRASAPAPEGPFAATR
jgi:hypothetical protein